MIDERIKLGEEVFVIERDEDGIACDYSGYMLVAISENAAIVSSFINDLETLEDTLNYHIQETCMNYSSDLAVFPIKDCYASGDECEDVLRQEQKA